MRKICIKSRSISAKTKHTDKITTLTICTYNIAHGRGSVSSNFKGGDKETRKKRLTDIARILKNADIVILNEVDFKSFWSYHFNQAEFITKEASFPYWVEQRNMDAGVPFFRLCYGNVLLSRFPIVSAHEVDFPGFSFWENILIGKKKGLFCILGISEMQEIGVLAVHLEHRSEKVRVQSVKKIEQFLTTCGVPLICAGDFNSSPSGFPESERDIQGTNAINQLLDTEYFIALPLDKPEESDLTFHSENPSRVIDWIFVPKRWKIISKKLKKETFSDHRPVFLYVSFQSIVKAIPKN